MLHITEAILFDRYDWYVNGQLLWQGGKSYLYAPQTLKEEDDLYAVLWRQSETYDICSCPIRLVAKTNLYEEPVATSLGEIDSEMLIEADCHVYDALGREVKQATLYKSQLDVSDLPHGVYLVVLISKYGQKIYKVVW